MNDNNNGDNDTIRIKRYAVLFLMGLRFYFLYGCFEKFHDTFLHYPFFYGFRVIL